jgi:hypothetical protein
VERLAQVVGLGQDSYPKIGNKIGECMDISSPRKKDVVHIKAATTPHRIIYYRQCQKLKSRVVKRSYLGQNPHKHPTFPSQRIRNPSLILPLLPLPSMPLSQAAVWVMMSRPHVLNFPPRRTTPVIITNSCTVPCGSHIYASVRGWASGRCGG